MIKLVVAFNLVACFLGSINLTFEGQRFESTVLLSLGTILLLYYGRQDDSN